MWANKEDKEFCLKMLSYLDIPTTRYVFIDLNYDSIDINKAKVIICFDRAYKDISRMFVSANIFKLKDMVGRDMIDESDKFMLFNIAYTMTQVITNEDNKQKVWNKLLMFQDYYNKMYPSNLDQVDVAESEPEVSEPVIEQVETDDPEDTTAIVDVQAFVNELAKHIDLADPAIGKTLSLSNKIELTTPSGNITIHPIGGRIPKDESAHLSIKDTIALLKTCLVFNATQIRFYKKDL